MKKNMFCLFFSNNRTLEMDSNWQTVQTGISKEDILQFASFEIIMKL